MTDSIKAFFVWFFLSLRTRSSEIIADQKTGKFNLTKLASATAYLAATFCFVWYHGWAFNLQDVARLQIAIAQLPFIWLLYMGTVGGHHLLNKNLDIKAAGLPGAAEAKE